MVFNSPNASYVVLLSHPFHFINLYLQGRALDYRKVIDDFVAKTRDLRHYELTPEDWSAIQLVSHWLKAFHSATTQMSTTKRSMLSSTQAIFRGLQESLSELPDNTPPRLKNSLIKAHRKLSDYYTKFDESLLYIWSSRKLFPYIHPKVPTHLLTVLDPRISYGGLLDDCGDDPTLQRHLEGAKDQLRQYYQDNYLASQATLAVPQPAAAAQTVSGSPQKVNFTARYKKRPTNLKDELEEYYRLPSEDFDACDPIQWWAGRCSQFPNLSRLARDILAIPGKLHLLKLLSVGILILCISCRICCRC